MLTKAQIEASPERPKALTVLAEGIPPQLADLPRWVVWRYVRRKGKWTKVLYNARGGEGDSTDPATWSTLAEALSAYRGGGWDGIGFALGGGTFGVDLDDAVDPDTREVCPWARKIIDRLDTYTEFSPSATGLKLLGLGRKPGKKCEAKYGTGKVEVYEHGRYFALTGRRLEGTSPDVRERTPQLAEVYTLVFGAAEKNKAADRPKATDGNNLSDDALLGKARAAANGEKFRRLYDRGDAGDDHSVADLSLLVQLGFWSGWDRSRMDRLFRGSALMRGKWDERRGEKTYGERTLDAAFDRKGESYSGNGHHAGGQQETGGGDAPPAGGGKPDQSGKAGRGDRTAYEIILGWFREQLAPQFRRGNVLYCEGAVGTVKTVRMAEVCDAPHPDLVELLTKAADAPTLFRSSEVDRTALVSGFFTRWARVAFKKLLSEHDEEDQAAEINGSAEEEFRGRLAAALLTHVTLGQNVKRDGLDVTEMQRRPLIEYAVAFAKKNGARWGDVRGYQIWSRLGAGKTPQVAIRKELFGQLQGLADLARLSATKFTRLCGMYGVGDGDRVKGGRSVVLSPGFLSQLQERPHDTLTDEKPSSRRRGRKCQSVRIDA
jgi:hypothetical protein